MSCDAIVNILKTAARGENVGVVHNLIHYPNFDGRTWAPGWTSRGSVRFESEGGGFAGGGGYAVLSGVGAAIRQDRSSGFWLVPADTEYEADGVTPHPNADKFRAVNVIVRATNQYGEPDGNRRRFAVRVWTMEQAAPVVNATVTYGDPDSEYILEFNGIRIGELPAEPDWKGYHVRYLPEGMDDIVRFGAVEIELLDPGELHVSCVISLAHPLYLTVRRDPSYYQSIPGWIIGILGSLDDSGEEGRKDAELPPAWAHELAKELKLKMIELDIKLNRLTAATKAAGNVKKAGKP